MSSQHKKNMTTSHFNIFLHIMITYKLHKSYVYALLFTLTWNLQLFQLWMNELGEVSVGKKSSINHNLVAWEVRG